MPAVDGLDVRILGELAGDPRIPVTVLAERLGAARNTVQARVERLRRTGVLRPAGQDVDLDRVGLGLTAFLTVEVDHKELDAVVAAVRDIPQLLEAHEVTGEGDLVCRLAAADIAELKRTVNRVHRIRGVIRTRTAVSLHEQIAYRVRPLLEDIAARGTGDGTGPAGRR